LPVGSYQGDRSLHTETTVEVAAPSSAKEFMLVLAISFISILLALTALSLVGFGVNSMETRLLAAALASVAVAVLVQMLVLQPYKRNGVGAGELVRAKVAQTGDETTITDPLTGIMNRHGITISVLDAMSLGERYGYPLSIALVDIDHLRKLNIEHGQEFGDQVLATIAGIIADSLRMPDKVGRFSGQQFLIVLPHTTLADAAAIAERTRALIADYDFDAGGQRVKLTASIGVTQYLQNEDLESLLTRAAGGVEQARANGRNMVAST